MDPKGNGVQLASITHIIPHTPINRNGNARIISEQYYSSQKVNHLDHVTSSQCKNKTNAKYIA